MNELAVQLNNDLRGASNAVFDLLSDRGRNIYFPSKGILGQSAEAKGKAINATIGTATEEDGSALCLECLEQLVSVPSSSFLYAPSFGLPELRTKWRDMLMQKNPGMAGRPCSLPVVTNALTHALSVVGYMFVNEGESILLPDLYWDNYELLFCEAYGARIQTYPTFVKGGYNVAGLEALLMADGEKKLVLINFPNNPTGYTATRSEALALRDAILRAAEKGKKIAVILDDAYFGLTYDEDVYPESLFSLLADLHSNVLAIKLDGPTKEDYVWGFRVGFISFGTKNATPAQLKALENKAAGVVRGSISNASNLGQALLLKAYESPDYPIQKQAKNKILRSRFQAIRDIFAAHPEYAESFEPMPFNSGYFMCVRVKGPAPETVRKYLLEKFDTGVIVLSGLVRLAFSSVPCAKLPALFENLHQAVRQLKSEAR